MSLSRPLNRNWLPLIGPALGLVLGFVYGSYRDSQLTREFKALHHGQAPDGIPFVLVVCTLAGVAAGTVAGVLTAFWMDRRVKRR